MINLPKIIDNNRVTLLDIFKNISWKYKSLSIATWYWDLLGMNMIFDNICNYEKIRILIGREPLIPRYKKNEPEPDYPDKDFFYDLEQLQPTNELKQLIWSIKKLINEWRLEIKVYRKNFLHAKCFIFWDYTSNNGIWIIWSSNFTKNWLTYNTELNALEPDHRIVTFIPQSSTQEVWHLYWFDQFWNDDASENWNWEFIQILEQSPVWDKLFTPFETYIKTLYEIYKDELKEEDLNNTIKWSHELLDFQIKNVHALIRRLKKYKVAMLADSVWLGKTYTAIELIKQYIADQDWQRRIEIICPKSLKSQWEKELATQGVFNCTPITLQNPKEIESKIKLDHIASVALFVIDESHNLKNRSWKRFEQIIDWIRNNKKAHVLLLTATPINNQLADIVNQILLWTRWMSDVLKVTLIDGQKQTTQINFIQAVENLKKKINQDMTRSWTIDYEYIKQVMMPILRAFVVRRTRQWIKKEYWWLNIWWKERHFPTVNPNISKYWFSDQITIQIRQLESKFIDLNNIYRITTSQIVDNTKNLMHPLDQIANLNWNISEDELDKHSAIYYVYQIVLLLWFIPYRWKIYQTKYYWKSREQIKEMKLNLDESKMLFLQLSIYWILRTMFLKRLESSISAIKTSLDTYRKKLDIFRRWIEIWKIISLKDIANLEVQLMLGDEDFDPDEIVLDEECILDDINDNKYNIKAIKDDIDKEYELINILSSQLWLLEQDDSKIKSFIKLIEEINNKKPAWSKVLVFSFYSDTIEYLKNNIWKYTSLINDQNSWFLSSKNRQNAEDFACRFSPMWKKCQLIENEKELNYLFSTDILSEWQNLQDCWILINYDLHWNPVRMIQRNGRINRLWTDFKDVYIYNISPESKLEEYLKLVERLEWKVNLIKHTIWTDSPVLDEKENPIEFNDSWQDIYSDNLQKRINALENAEKEADMLLSEDEYVSDLKLFHNNPNIDKKYKESIYWIAKWKWAIMPNTSNKSDILIFSSAFDEHWKEVWHNFFAINRKWWDFQAISHLQALEWLKTNKNNDIRQFDKISINKAEIWEIAKIKIEAYWYNEWEVWAPIWKQVEILRIMFDIHCHEEDIEHVRLWFQSNNIIDKQKINKLVRQIISSRSLDLINELIKISKKTIWEKNKNKSINHSKQLLFYSKENA